MRQLVIISLLVVHATTNAQHTEITWSDLISHMEFKDPFKLLNSEQLYNLSQVARLRDKEKSSDYQFSAGEKTLKDSLETYLINENINTDSLLAIRFEIAELRRKKAEEVNQSLNKKNVKISGYLLPLNYVDDKTTEFLLVPWVGACIHTPPPPKNQLIYLTSDVGLEVNSRFMAVSVQGMIETVSKSSKLFLVDGSDNISSGYSIVNSTITELK